MSLVAVNFSQDQTMYCMTNYKRNTGLSLTAFAVRSEHSTLISSFELNVTI